MPPALNGLLSSSPDAFHRMLPRYVNGGCLFRRDRVGGLIHSGLPFRLNAARVIRRFEQFRRTISAVPVKAPISVDVEPYAGRDPHVIQMMDYLHAHLRGALVGAYVHGSLGTYEATPYSDFDALVILRDEVFSSPSRLIRTARMLDTARSIMLQFDPLQHHGWFVLTEAQLSAYPEHYFPSPLFEYAKALLPAQGCTLTVSPVAAPGRHRDGVLNLSASIIHRIERRRFPANLYELKFVLSQFMLLPAMYVQARDGQGVFKKYTFDLARTDFRDDDWLVMDEVSAIRQNWEPVRQGVRWWLLTRGNKPIRSLTSRWAPGIPRSLQRVLTEDFYSRMQRLALRMRQRVEQMEPAPQ